MPPYRVPLIDPHQLSHSLPPICFISQFSSSISEVAQRVPGPTGCPGGRSSNIRQGPNINIRTKAAPLPIHGLTFTERIDQFQIEQTLTSEQLQRLSRPSDPMVGPAFASFLFNMKRENWRVKRTVPTIIYSAP